MNKIYRILFTTFIAAASLSASAKELTLMSYNVRNGRNLHNERTPELTAKVIKAQKPDIVAIQEVDSMTNRSGKTYLLGQLAKATGMKDYFAPAIDYDGGKYGIGILCRKEPIKITRRALPGREEQRAIIIAEFPDYVFASTHLSLTEEDRLASAAIIKELARQSDKPFFIAGDLNAHPDEAVISTLDHDFEILTPTDTPTFPADEPTETIDYIMVRNAANPVELISSRVVEAKEESDHRPVIVRVKL